MNEKRQLTIHFMDGSKAYFEFPEQTNPVNITQHVLTGYRNSNTIPIY